MKADLFFWWFWRWREKRAKLLEEVAQNGIVKEECIIDPQEPLHDSCVYRKLLAHLHERADNKPAHLHSARAVKNVGCLKRSVFREGVGSIPAPTVRT